MGVDSFLNQTLQELTDCLFWFIHSMKMHEKGILPLDIIYQKVLLIIITSSMEKTNQLILI